jgi:uncharacterized membrane protein YqjE
MDAQSVPSLIAAMIGTRLQLAAVDIEAHVQATLVALITAFVAVVLGLIAFAFIGVAVIVFFWDTHRVVAAVAVLVFYGAVAAVLAAAAKSRWKSRPAAFAGTVHELELDAQAFGGRS